MTGFPFCKIQKRSVLLSSLIARPMPFWLHEELGRAMVSFLVCDVKGRKVVERTILNVGELGLRTAREELRHLVTYLTLCS